MNPKNLPLAACVLLPYQSGSPQMLGVSRKDNPDHWGLPGGKVDEGETPAEAATRECWEETGVTPMRLRLLYEGECQGGADGKAFWTYTFLADESIGRPEYKGQGQVEWTTKESLLSGPFQDYNSRMLAALHKYRTVPRS